MKNLDDVQQYMVAAIGPDATALFAAHMDDTLYYARALAFNAMGSDEKDVEIHFKEVAEQTLSETMNFYLQRYYASDDGFLDVNVSYDRIYDKDMNIIEPIQQISTKRKEITGVIVGCAMQTYKRGRIIADKMVQREHDYIKRRALRTVDPSPKDVNWDPSISPLERDYGAVPPAEQYEIEIMRLERKLPYLTSDESKRLVELYRKLHSH